MMSTQNFKCNLKFFPEWEFLAQILQFGQKMFPTKTRLSDNFPTAQNLGGKQRRLPPAPAYDGTAM